MGERGGNMGRTSGTFTARLPQERYVYFIQSGGEDGPIKIGVTTDPALRVKRLQTGSAAPLRLLGTIKGDEALERAYHAHFAAYRLRGEWFSPAPEVLAAIPPQIDSRQRTFEEAGELLDAAIAYKLLEASLREYRI
jgi:hypothetical protein